MVKHRSPHLEQKLIFWLVMKRQDRQDLNRGNEIISRKNEEKLKTDVLSLEGN